jgi:DME family drug/metabolite transporter
MPHSSLVLTPSAQQRAEHRFAVLAVLGAAVLFGTTGTAKELGPDSASALGVGATRIIFGALTLWLIAHTMPRWRDLRAYGHLLVIGGLGVAAYQPGFFAGTERLGVALGTIIALGSGPLFAGMLELALGNRPGVQWLMATAVSIVGGALLVIPSATEADFSVVGLLAALTAGFGYAVYAVVTKRLILRGLQATVASAWQFSIGAVVLLPFLAGEPMGWLRTPSGLAMALWLGVVATGVAYLLYGFGLRSLDTATATTLTLAEPVTAAMFAMVVLDERLSPIEWVGAAFVVVGLALAGGKRASGARPTTSGDVGVRPNQKESSGAQRRVR